MGYVFIRYVKQDKAFVDQLSVDLQAAGVEIWNPAQNILPGQEWGDAMRDAIQGADALLYFSSQHAARSPLMARDLEIALQNNVPVLPIFQDYRGFQGMPKALYGILWIDFRKDYQMELAQLIERIPASAQRNQPITPRAEQSKGYVFISYAEEDTDFVEHLRQFLEDRDYSYWDYQESERDYHNQLFLELEEVIRNAAATLSVLSPDWKLSDWATKEFLFSREVDTPVFLLQARTMEPTLLTTGVPYIDFVHDVTMGFQKLEAELVRKGLL